MVGGNKETFDKHIPMLEVLGKSVVLTGEIGALNDVSEVVLIASKNDVDY